MKLGFRKTFSRKVNAVEGDRALLFKTREFERSSCVCVTPEEPREDEVEGDQSMVLARRIGHSFLPGIIVPVSIIGSGELRMFML